MISILTAVPTAPRAASRIPRAAATGAVTVPGVLRRRAAQQPDRMAFVFLVDGEEPGESLTYAQLDQAATERASTLRAAGLNHGNALMLYPPGLEFVKSLFGCMYAGITGAPVQVPTRERGYERLRKIADDSGARVLLTDTATLAGLRAGLSGSRQLDGLTLLATDAPPAASADATRSDATASRATGSHGAAVAHEPQNPDLTALDPNGTALLQYTSGSTGDPKGVVISHANFLANAAETDELWPCGEGAVFVSWLPHVHDMGMLFGIIAPLWAGAPSYLMAPAAFVRRPGRWPQAISRFRGTHSAGPSFAYELCVREAAQNGVPEDLDLSCWRVAGNGAEPVRWGVVEQFTDAYRAVGFRPEAMCPGFGLAENTLKASGSPLDAKPTVLWVDPDALREDRVEQVPEDKAGALPLVGSGFAVGETRLRIVDPVTREALPEGRVGEIWISGPCVAAGYLGREQENREIFRARLAGEQNPESPTHLRTGDLGFMHRGELFVAGRLKDVIIRKGRNYYPQDIEFAVESAEPRLGPNSSVAFSVDDGTAEQLVLVVEAAGRAFGDDGPEALRERIRAAVYDSHRLHADDVVLVRRGSLPKTSSGKVQRRSCRRQYLEGTLALTAIKDGN